MQNSIRSNYLYACSIFLGALLVRLSLFKLTLNVVICFLGVIPLISSSLLAQDVVIMKNGDRITGEIKKLSNGDLHIDPSYGENIFIIDWAEVERVESKERFIVQTSRGAYLTGSVNTNPQVPAQILVEAQGQTTPFEQDEVVYLKPVDEGFWGRFSASADFGLSLTKANDTKQMNTRLTAGYLAEKWSSSFMFDALRNYRDAVDPTRRTEVGGDYRYFFSGSWFGLGTASFLQSNELQLDLRSTLGGGAGHYFVRNNRWRFSALGGAGWTNENLEDPTEETKNSGEVFAGVELDAFDIGDVSILSSFTIIPSLTQSGRVRMDFRTDFQWELIKDLFFRVGFTDNYDNQPTGDAPTNDYIFSTSVGWSF